MHEREIAAFLRDDQAAGLVEYALILGLIAVAAILAMVFMREQLVSLFSSIGNTTHNAPCQGQQQLGQCP